MSSAKSGVLSSDLPCFITNFRGEARIEARSHFPRNLIYIIGAFPTVYYFVAILSYQVNRYTTLPLTILCVCRFRLLIA